MPAFPVPIAPAEEPNGLQMAGSAIGSVKFLNLPLPVPGRIESRDPPRGMAGQRNPKTPL